MGATLLPELATEIVIPVCAVVGIVFSLVQWFLVSRVKLTSETSSSPRNNKNGYGAEYLIEEEEGINDHSVVAKCAEIQNAISEGKVLWVRSEDLYLRSGCYTPLHVSLFVTRRRSRIHFVRVFSYKHKTSFLFCFCFCSVGFIYLSRCLKRKVKGMVTLGCRFLMSDFVIVNYY